MSKKRPTRARKRRGKVVVRESAKIVRKSSKSDKIDTLSATPIPHSNSAVMKVRIKRK